MTGNGKKSLKSNVHEFFQLFSRNRNCLWRVSTFVLCGKYEMCYNYSISRKKCIWIRMRTVRFRIHWKKSMHLFCQFWSSFSTLALASHQGVRILHSSYIYLSLQKWIKKLSTKRKPKLIHKQHHLFLAEARSILFFSFLKFKVYLCLQRDVNVWFYFEFESRYSAAKVGAHCEY